MTIRIGTSFTGNTGRAEGLRRSEEIVHDGSTGITLTRFM